MTKYTIDGREVVGSWRRLRRCETEKLTLGPSNVWKWHL